MSLLNCSVFSASTEAWKSRWTVSDHKKDEGTAGVWDVTPGKIYGDAAAEAGLTTTEDARFYAISSQMKEFSSVGKTLVVQFSVKHDQGIDCGGGYIKIAPAGIDQTKFNGDSPYNIMFGPDICGATRRIHAIFNHEGKNKLISKEVSCETDKNTHVYTLIVNGADLTYQILVDGEKRQSGNLEDDWDFLAPKQVPNPAITKPADWVDEPMMVDPADVKPADYDDIPAKIPDPDAFKPDDWDEELDGVWEAPTIANPAFKGPWQPKKIANPAYKGAWEQPKMDNPAYKVRLRRYNAHGTQQYHTAMIKSPCPAHGRPVARCGYCFSDLAFCY